MGPYDELKPTLLSLLFNNQIYNVRYLGIVKIETDRGSPLPIVAYTIA